jgi:hypothetical protein
MNLVFLLQPAEVQQDRRRSRGHRRQGREALTDLNVCAKSEKTIELAFIGAKSPRSAAAGQQLRSGKGTRISSDEEYEDVGSPTMTVEPPSTPIGVPFDSATGKGKRFIFADYEEEDVIAPTTVVAAGGSAVAATTTPVIPLGTVRDRVAALESAAVGLLGMAAQPPLPPPRVFVAVATQTDQTVFPFVG